MAQIFELWPTRLRTHFQRHKWEYVFAALIWAWVWYATMDALAKWNPDSSWNFDLMPVIAGILVIPLGWHAVSLDRQLKKSIDGFDEGAALAFPSGQPAAKRKFLYALRASISWWSRLIAATLVAIAIFVVALSPATNFHGNPTDVAASFLLVVGLPLIVLPIGILLGRLVAYAQLFRIMDRNDITLAGLGTPQARQALRGFQSVISFSVLATAVLCLWFAAWLISWVAHFELFDYENEWKKTFLIWDAISIVLFIAAGSWPAWRFSQRFGVLSGGPERLGTVKNQVEQAQADLATLSEVAGFRTRRQREQIAQLKQFIDNLSEQQIGSWMLDLWLHGAFIAFNLVVFAASLLTARP